jgi:hypothetical protein
MTSLEIIADFVFFLVINQLHWASYSEVGKVTFKSNNDEALSDEFLLKSNGDEALKDVFL